MSDKQLKLYNKIVKTENTNNNDYINNDISNSFFVGSRMISNFYFPNEQINKKGYNSLLSKHLVLKNLMIYSPKFYRIIRKINKCNGTVFVYSNFKEYGGMKTFIKVLEYYKYKNYASDGSGTDRYAVWSGDQTPVYKEEVKSIFNNKKNEYGKFIKIILGTPSIKEGVSLFRIQQVHLIEPYWNMSRIDQIIGRAVRFCSHKDVEPERRAVNVYMYLATHPSLKKSIDERIMMLAIHKKKLNLDFERALKESAVDCQLFKNANKETGENKYVCDI